MRVRRGTGALWVRPATLDDVSALVALRAEMFRAMGAGDVDSLPWQDSACAWFAVRVEDPDYGIFVVDVDGDVVAAAIGAIRDSAPSPTCPAGRDVLISNVCTLPEHRGSGHGSAAFAAVMAWARKAGVDRAELMATDGGRRIYEREGFELNRFPAMRATLNRTRTV